MRIGIDIDDTLVNTSESFEEVIKKHNINFSKNWKDEWTKDEMNFIFNKYLAEILLGAKFKENSIKIVNQLHELGHELIVITARSNNYCETIKEKTLEILKREDLKISEFYFEQNKKSDLAKKLNVDLMIDDSKYVYDNMKNDGIDCILFGDKIKTWNEVLEYIKEKEE
jgi:acid phosphatase class B